MLTARGTRVAAPRLCAALLGAGTAETAVNAQLNLEDLGWSLVDLRPGDGIAPGVTFDASRINSRMVASVQETLADADGRPLPYPSDSRNRYVGKAISFLWEFVSAETSSAGTSSSQGGSVDGHSFGARVFGRAVNAVCNDVYLNRFEARSVPASSSFVGAIVLVPCTALVWTGHLSLQVEKSSNGDKPAYERSVSAFSLRMLDAEGRRLGGYSTRMDTEGHADGLLKRDQELHFLMVNRGGTALAGTLEASLRVGGYTALNPVFAPAVAAVPEPGTVGLMLAGVGVVGVAARRAGRQRGGAPCVQ